MIENLLKMTKKSQYKELMKNGTVKVDYKNKHVEISVIDYYGTKWWLHLCDGQVVQVIEI